MKTLSSVVSAGVEEALKEWRVVDVSRIKVEIVDPSAFARAALPRLIEADPQLEVVGVAQDGEEGLKHTLEHDPDVVLLALGSRPSRAVELVESIMARSPRPVIVLTSPKVEAGPHLLSLEAGAVAAVSWDVDSNRARLMAFQSLLASKIKAYGAARHSAEEHISRLVEGRGGPGEEAGASGRVEENDVEVLEEQVVIPANSDPSKPRSPLALTESQCLILPSRTRATAARDPDRRAEVAVLGAGAGGIAPFRQILLQLPADLNLALIGVLCLPPELLHRFAERLDQDSAYRVLVASEGEPVRAGALLITPAGTNLGMVRTGRIPKALARLAEPEPGLGAIPSLDVTLRACATIYGHATAGVILSGLSRDGMAGLQAIKAKGGISAVLDIREAVVSSTNQLCLDAGAVDEVLSIGGIVALLSQLGRPH